MEAGILRHRLFSIAVVLALVRLALAFAINPAPRLENDERLNYDTAQNHVLGHGYTLVDPYTHAYKATAFHNSFTVLLYEGMIHWSVPPELWVVSEQMASAALYMWSVLAFFAMARRVLADPWAFGAALLYALYPSVFFYIGALFMHENIALPLLVVIAERLLRCLEATDTPTDHVIIAIGVVVSVVLRPQTLVVLGLLIGSALLMTPRARRWSLVGRSLVLAVLIFVVHVPVLLKHKAQFGHMMLSTQAGFELLQGHNPLARGSWMGGWDRKDNPLYQYVHREIPGIDSFDEYEESRARAALAVRWMQQEPLNEVLLDLRKLAIWLLPMNYGGLPAHDRPNGINGVVHLFFGVAVVLLLFRWQHTPSDTLLLMPVLGSLLLTIVFFMGARWRYYAEPFMVLFAVRAMAFVYDAFLPHRRGDGSQSG